MRIENVYVAVLIACAPAVAQSKDSEEHAGLTLGIAGGGVQHHFTVQENGNDREVDGFGFGGAATVGYLLPLAERILVGAEASFHFGGKKAETLIFAGQSRLGIDPRYGWSAVGRVGYAISPKVMLFGSAGYGEHRYTLIQPSGATPANPVKATNSSFVLGAGAEYRIGSKFSLRADLRHLDGSRNELFFGVQTRF